MEGGRSSDDTRSAEYRKDELSCADETIDEEIRAFFDEALAQSKSGKPLIDVRSPGEYKGEITHMAEYPQEGVLRGGHIPGAKSSRGKRRRTMTPRSNLRETCRKIYFDQCGVGPEKDTVVYCRIG